jgi:hypothetical protein
LSKPDIAPALCSSKHRRRNVPLVRRPQHEVPPCAVWNSAPLLLSVVLAMMNLRLYDFIAENRDELIGRCRAKVAKRSSPPPTEAEITHGVPVFLDQLCEVLRNGPMKNEEINRTAMAHGRELLLHKFTVSQVVHDYGDVCQSITDLAVELTASISTEDFRTLNRCLDDAIAGAVTQFERGESDTRDGKSNRLEDLIDGAITAFEMLRTGSVGAGGSTGTIVLRNLMFIRDAVDELRSKASVSEPAAKAE